MSWTNQTAEDIARAKRDELLLKWQNASAALENAKVAETQARLEVTQHLYPQGVPEGTNNIDLGKGYTLKVVGKMNYNLSESAKPRNAAMKPFATRVALNEIEKLGNEGKFIAERLVKWQPELSLTEYRQLGDQYKKIIDTALTISPGIPSIEIVEPKGK